MKRYLIPIIVSAVSLVVMTVVTYAYFTATIDPSGETTATLRTATVGTVTFVTESPSSNLTNVYPGWEGEIITPCSVSAVSVGTCASLPDNV